MNFFRFFFQNVEKQIRLLEKCIYHIVKILGNYEQNL